jgi:hypothetical protein
MMMALRCPAPLALPRLPKLLPWLRERMALRIDVELRPEDLHADLDELHRRLNAPGDALFGLPEIGSPGPGFVCRYREADGEHYVYVEDVVRRKLAGYTVFNRLIEVGRKADPYLRAPHSKYAAAYQRRGLATAVYQWGLGAGICLMSGARQSAAAHGLWCALSRQHELHHVHVENKALQHLGSRAGTEVCDDLNTRMLLLGQGWSLPKLMQATGMRPHSLSQASGRAAHQ